MVGEIFCIKLKVKDYTIGHGSVTARIENIKDTIVFINTKISANLSVEDANADYGENITLNLDYNDTATGTFNITINGKKYNKTFENIPLNKTITLKDIILPGEYNLTIAYSGDETFANATATAILTVNKLKTEIKVDRNDIYFNATDGIMFTITLPGNATGNLTISNGITLNVSKEGRKEGNYLIVEIKNNAYPVGQYNWTFTYLGDDIYKNATAKATANILPVETKITANTTSELFVDDNAKIDYKLTPEDAVGKITFTSNDTSVVKVDQDGNITAISEGTALITVTFEGNRNYTSSNTTLTVTVSKIATSINVENATVNIEALENISSGATLTPPEAGNLTYKSSNETVAIVENGQIKALREDTAIITVSYNGTYKYAAAENKTITVTVNLKDASINVTKTKYNLYIDEQDTINTTTTPTDLKVKYETNNNDIITIDENGTITALKEGNATITISFAGNDKYATAENKTITVTVSLKDASINVTKTKYNLYVDEQDTINTITTPTGLKVKYETNNNDIITVDENGTITALKEGNATITVSVGDNITYKYNSTTINVTVNKIPTRIELQNKTINLTVNDKYNTNATLIPNVGNLTYKSNNTNIITIDKNGTITAHANGTATITVSYNGTYKYAAAENKTITVTVRPNDAKITTDVDELELEVGSNETVNIYLDPKDLEFRFTSSDPSVATIDENGTVTAHKIGNTTITLTVGGDGVYALNSTSINITVTQIKTEITANTTSKLFIDNKTKINYNITPSDAVGDVKFESNDTNVVKVDSDGNITAVGEGTALISVTFEGSENYAASNTTVTVTVSKITTTIKVENATLKMEVPENISSGATLTPPEAGNLTYTSSKETIVIIENGQIKALAKGSAIITVSFAGNNKYAAAENKTIMVSVGLDDASVSVNNNTLDLEVDDEFTLVATTIPKGLKVKFESSNETVATVDDKGNVKAISEGKAIITVSVGGDGEYAYNSTEVQISISKVPTKITLENETMDLKVKEIVNIGATLDPNVGNLTYKSSNESVAIVENGQIKALREGTAIITVSFNGTEKYAAAENKTITVTVSLNDAKINTDVDNLVLEVGTNKTVNIYLDPEDLEFRFTSSDPSVATIDENGTVIAHKIGNTTITLTVGGDGVYALNSTSINITVTQIKTEITANTTSELFVDAKAKIDYNLTPEDAVGKITFSSNDTNVVKVNTISGEITAVGEGTALISVTFEGSENYTSSNTTLTVTVSKIPTEIILQNETMNLKIKDEVDAEASLMPSAAGNLTYTSSDKSIATVNANGTITAVGEGTTTITVSFAGNKKYSASNTTIKVIVSLKDASVIVEPESLELIVGENGEIYPTTNPDGLDVKFTSSNESIITVENKDGTGYVTAVGEGNATITVTINEKDYVNNSTTVNVIVKAKVVPKENLTLEAVADPITVGENATIVVTGFANATGNATARAGNGIYIAPIVDSTAIFNIPDLTENTTAIITYNGDDKYNNASTTVDITVNPKQKENTKMDIDVAPVTEGQNTTININLPEDATGNITATVNGKTYTASVENGKATITIPDLTAGNYTVPVTYSGNDKYNPASTSVNITVNPKQKENATMDIDVPPVTEGQNTTININLPEDATGNVTATLNNKTYTAPVENGKATITIPDLTAGNYTVPVTYSGDEKYNSLTQEVNITVEEDKSDIIKADDLTKYYHGSERFVVNLTDYQGNPLANKTVSININGASYNRTTDSNGQASMAINLNSGKYQAVASYNGKSVNATITVLPTVNGTDVVKVYRNATQYYATFRDSEGNYLKDGTTVRFNINGVFYDRQISGEKGMARLNLNLEQGTYILTAMNPETGENAANNITILSRLTENRDVTKYYRNATQYTVKVIGDDGKAVGAGETVRFNINGVFYERTTDESGIAKLNLNLQPGDYIITAEYKNCRVSNNIKILPVLAAEDLTKKYGTKDPFIATLVDGQGKAYANQTVTFNIHGVFYNRITDSSGQAKLNINLQPGKYIITSSYNGASIANKITITG